MFSSFWVSKAFCKTEINDVYVVLLFADSNQEVIGLDVSMQEVAGVYELNSLQHLICEHQNGLQAEFPFTII